MRNAAAGIAALGFLVAATAAAVVPAAPDGPGAAAPARASATSTSARPAPTPDPKINEKTRRKALRLAQRWHVQIDSHPSWTAGDLSRRDVELNQRFDPGMGGRESGYVGPPR